MNTVLIGLAAGYFSGHFGLGGAILSSPGLRLILGVSAFTAVGSAMPANIATALVGGLSYGRQGHVDRKLFLPLAASGMAGATVGAAVTGYVDGSVVLLLTATTLLLLGLRFIFSREHHVIHPEPLSPRSATLVAAGLFIGLFSGFIGLGGGFFLIPFFRMGLKLDLKTAFGTSMTIIGAITLPGFIIHYLLGHVDLRLSALLILGVVPGALIGARVALSLPESLLSRVFGVILTAIALYLGYNEILVLTG